MENKRFFTQFNIKVVATMLTLVLAIGGVIGGTVAWLIATPDPVVNTFTYGDINIELDETDTNDGDDNENTNEYKMMPGQAITKDPVVTVVAGSEEMWLFVKLDKAGGATVGEETYTFDDYLTYTVDGSWAKLEGVDNVWYRHITAEEVATEDMEIHVLAEDKVMVNEDVTKEMLNALNADEAAATYPTLTVTAYAVQAAGNATAADAWGRVEVPETP